MSRATCSSGVPFSVTDNELQPMERFFQPGGSELPYCMSSCLREGVGLRDGFYAGFDRGRKLVPQPLEQVVCWATRYWVGGPGVPVERKMLQTGPKVLSSGSSSIVYWGDANVGLRQLDVEEKSH